MPLFLIRTVAVLLAGCLSADPCLAQICPSRPLLGKWLSITLSGSFLSEAFSARGTQNHDPADGLTTSIAAPVAREIAAQHQIHSNPVLPSQPPSWTYTDSVAFLMDQIVGGRRMYVMQGQYPTDVDFEQFLINAFTEPERLSKLQAKSLLGWIEVQWWRYGGAFEYSAAFLMLSKSLIRQFSKIMEPYDYMAPEWEETVQRGRSVPLNSSIERELNIAARLCESPLSKQHPETLPRLISALQAVNVITTEGMPAFKTIATRNHFEQSAAVAHTFGDRPWNTLTFHEGLRIIEALASDLRLSNANKLQLQESLWAGRHLEGRRAHVTGPIAVLLAELPTTPPPLEHSYLFQGTEYTLIKMVEEYSHGVFTYDGAYVAGTGSMFFSGMYDDGFDVNSIPTYFVDFVHEKLARGALALQQLYRRHVLKVAPITSESDQPDDEMFHKIRSMLTGHAVVLFSSRDRLLSHGVETRIARHGSNSFQTEFDTPERARIPLSAFDVISVENPSNAGARKQLLETWRGIAHSMGITEFELTRQELLALVQAQDKAATFRKLLILKQNADLSPANGNSRDPMSALIAAHRYIETQKRTGSSDAAIFAHFIIDESLAPMPANLQEVELLISSALAETPGSEDLEAIPVRDRVRLLKTNIFMAVRPKRKPNADDLVIHKDLQPRDETTRREHDYRASQLDRMIEMSFMNMGVSEGAGAYGNDLFPIKVPVQEAFILRGTEGPSIEVSEGQATMSRDDRSPDDNFWYWTKKTFIIRTRFDDDPKALIATLLVDNRVPDEVKARLKNLLDRTPTGNPLDDILASHQVSHLFRYQEPHAGLIGETQLLQLLDALGRARSKLNERTGFPELWNTVLMDYELPFWRNDLREWGEGQSSPTSPWVFTDIWESRMRPWIEIHLNRLDPARPFSEYLKDLPYLYAWQSFRALIHVEDMQGMGRMRSLMSRTYPTELRHYPFIDQDQGKKALWDAIERTFAERFAQSVNDDDPDGFKDYARESLKQAFSKPFWEPSRGKDIFSGDPFWKEKIKFDSGLRAYSIKLIRVAVLARVAGEESIYQEVHQACEHIPKSDLVFETFERIWNIKFDPEDFHGSEGSPASKNPRIAGSGSATLYAMGSPSAWFEVFRQNASFFVLLSGLSVAILGSLPIPIVALLSGGLAANISWPWLKQIQFEPDFRLSLKSRAPLGSA